jgi:predicted GNAT family N-acyltransferase
MSETPKIQLIESQSTWPLRHAILRPHQNLKDCQYPGDDLPTTFHLGAFQNTKIMGIASVYKEKTNLLTQKNQYRLRGMATSEEVRGQGYARKLIESLEDIVLKRKDADAIYSPLQSTAIWFNARESAFSFYEKMGYVYLTDLFEIDGIGPHRVMYKILNSKNPHHSAK